MDIHAEANSPAQAAQLSQKSLAFTDPYLYLVQPQFNRRVRCRRTNKRITFADVGDPEGPPVLFFLPSACSRYVAVVCDGLAREVGVRMVAMDRPGSGGTEQCPLKERVKIVGDMTESLIEHLDLKNVMVLTASAGMIHALDYIRLHPERLSRTHPTLCCLSPWVPGNMYLPWIPATLVANGHRVFPTIQASGLALESGKNKMSSWSSWSSESTAALIEPVEDAHATLEQGPLDTNPSTVTRIPAAGRTKFHHRFMLPETINLVQKYMFAESQQGMSQEHLLSLGKGVPGSGKDKIGTRDWYAATVDALRTPFGPKKDMILDSVTHGHARLDVRIWWGELDGIVPRKARDILNGLFGTSPACDLVAREINGADHDDPIVCMEGIGEALKLLKQQADRAGWSRRETN